MKSARLKLFFSMLLLGGMLLASRAYAAQGNTSPEQVKADLSEIKTRLTALENGQKEILAKEDKILQELDRVRIWVHKR